MSVLALAVQGALAAMAMMPMIASADDNADLKALTQPNSFVEIGATNVSNGSDKFGEYNGLNKSGVYGIGNLDVRGGDAYTDKGNTRWEVYGKDLGTTSREFGVNVADQGSWNFGLRRDELTHYITDTFQTPFQGAMGGNVFALPSNFGVINTVNNTKNLPYGTQALTATQQADFQTQDIHSGRTNTGLSAGFSIDKQWSVQFDYNRLAQNGAKLISAASDGFGTSGTVGVGVVVPQYAYGLAKGESPVMLANPTNFSTDTIELTTNWIGEKGHFTASLYGSIFHDNYSDVEWTSPYFGNGATVKEANGAAVGASGYPVEAISTPPSNTLVQASVSGGYNLAPKTKLTGGLSYGRNTQNQAYVNVPGGADNLMQNSITLANGTTAAGLPQNSLNGLVVTTHADLKLTDQSIKDWSFLAAVKYNERDNRTEALPYGFLNIDPAGTLSSTGGLQASQDPAGTAVNTPMSLRKTDIDLSADYKIDHAQNVRVAYNYEKIERWCDSALANNAGLLYGSDPNAGGTAAAYYGSTASCVQVPDSKENKIGLNYRFKPTDDLSLNAGYSYADRKADVLTSFYSPLSAYNAGEGYENYGYVAYFDASRTEQLLKASVNWQANDQLNLGLSGKYAKDDYNDSALGMQSGSIWSLNLDATYQLGEKSSISAYATAQKRERDLLSENGRNVTYVNVLKEWQTKYSDNDYTIGLNLKQDGLLSGKLSVAADLTYSNSTTGWNTSTIAAPNIAGGVTCAGILSASTSGYSCGATPDITTKLAVLKLSGVYTLNKQSQVGFGVLFQHLNADDYIYNAYQMGYTPTSVMPSNQQSPSYSISTIYATYRYNFSCL